MSVFLKRFILVCLLRCLMEFIVFSPEAQTFYFGENSELFGVHAYEDPGTLHSLTVPPPPMGGHKGITSSHCPLHLWGALMILHTHASFSPTMLGTWRLCIFSLSSFSIVFQCTRSITFFFYTNNNNSLLIESFCPCSWRLHQDTFMMRSKRNFQHPYSETMYSHYNFLTEVCLQFRVRRTACSPKTAPEDLQFSFQKLLILNTIYFLNFPLKFIL